MLLWSDEYAAPEESAWGMLQKLAWLNTCRPAEALHVLLDGKVSLTTLQGHPRSLLDSAWLKTHLGPSTGNAPGQEDRSRHAILRRRLYAATGGGAFGEFAGKLMAAELRACNQCLAQGLHLQLHQIAGIQCCPLHGCPMTYECENCGQPRGSFTNAGGVGGFRCLRCGKCWLKRGWLTPARGLELASILRKVTPFMAWLRKSWSELQQMTDVGYLHAVPNNTLELEPLPMPDAALGLCLEVHPYADASAVAPSLISNVSCHTITAPVGSATTKGTMSRRRYIELTCSTIDAELSTLISEHSRCISMASFVMRSSSFNGTHYTTISPNACVFAQAYSLWKERVKMLLKAEEDARVTPLWGSLVPICLRSSLHAVALEVLTVAYTLGCDCEVCFVVQPDPWLRRLWGSEHEVTHGCMRVLRLDLGVCLASLHCDGGATGHQRIARIHRAMAAIRLPTRVWPTGSSHLRDD